jgi:hypothetical protein
MVFGTKPDFGAGGIRASLEAQKQRVSKLHGHHVLLDAHAEHSSSGTG